MYDNQSLDTVTTRRHQLWTRDHAAVNHSCKTRRNN